MYKRINITNFIPLETKKQRTYHHFMCRLFHLLALLLIICLHVSGNPADEDYNRLSEKSTDQLMNEGRKYFEMRQGGKALSRFLIVGGKYNENSTAEEIENSIKALNNAGCVYKYLYYDYVTAYEYFTKAYNLCEANKLDTFLPVIMVNIGDLLNDYGTIHNSDTIVKQAEEMFEKCFKIALEQKNWELLTTAFFNISNLNYEIDLSKYKALFRKDIPENSPDILFTRLQYLGIQKLQEKKYAESRQYFERQFKAINTPWESNRDIIAAHLNIAMTYGLEKNYTEQAAQLEKALEKAEESGLKDLTINISKQLADTYEKKGDPEKYQQVRQLYLEKMEDMRNSRLENVAELKYLNDLKIEEDRARQLLYRQTQQRYVIFAIIIILIITIFFIVIIWQKNRRLHANSKILYDKYQKLLAADSAGAERKYSKSNLNESQKENLIARIKEVLENPENICRQDFSSKELAKMTDSNTTYVSQAINETYGVSFSTLLGNYRIKEACRQINESSRFDQLTIEGIANSVGFKSRTAFLNAFKREVGLSPSEYIKLAKEAREKQS